MKEKGNRERGGGEKLRQKMKNITEWGWEICWEDERVGSRGGHKTRKNEFRTGHQFGISVSIFWLFSVSVRSSVLKFRYFGISKCRIIWQMFGGVVGLLTVVVYQFTSLAVSLADVVYWEAFLVAGTQILLIEE